MRESERQPNPTEQGINHEQERPETAYKRGEIFAEYDGEVRQWWPHSEGIVVLDSDGKVYLINDKKHKQNEGKSLLFDARRLAKSNGCRSVTEYIKYKLEQHPQGIAHIEWDTKNGGEKLIIDEGSGRGGVLRSKRSLPEHRYFGQDQMLVEKNGKIFRLTNDDQDELLFSASEQPRSRTVEKGYEWSVRRGRGSVELQPNYNELPQNLVDFMWHRQGCITVTKNTDSSGRGWEFFFRVNGEKLLDRSLNNFTLGYWPVEEGLIVRDKTGFYLNGKWILAKDWEDDKDITCEASGSNVMVIYKDGKVVRLGGSKPIVVVSNVPADAEVKPDLSGKSKNGVLIRNKESKQWRIYDGI